MKPLELRHQTFRANVASVVPKVGLLRDACCAVPIFLFRFAHTAYVKPCFETCQHMIEPGGSAAARTSF
jgi:hypothetical protein